MLLAGLVFFACGPRKSESVPETAPTAQIGGQIWMASNMNSRVFRNGDAIALVENDEDWQRAGEEGVPAMCFYGNDPDNGALYNWHAVTDSRGLAPKGWHVASEEEWFEMLLSFGMTQREWYSDSGTANENWKPTGEGGKLKSPHGWRNNGNGSNESGFRAMPVGCRGYTGPFLEQHVAAYFWTSTPRNGNAWYRRLSGDHDSVGRSFSTPGFGYSVRCVKDRDANHE